MFWHDMSKYHKRRHTLRDNTHDDTLVVTWMYAYLSDASSLLPSSRIRLRQENIRAMNLHDLQKICHGSNADGSITITNIAWAGSTRRIPVRPRAPTDPLPLKKPCKCSRPWKQQLLFLQIRVSWIPHCSSMLEQVKDGHCYTGRSSWAGKMDLIQVQSKCTGSNYHTYSITRRYTRRQRFVQKESFHAL